MSIEKQGVAVVIGASGAIGSHIIGRLRALGQFESVLGFSRSVGSQRIDITSDESVSQAAASVAALNLPIRLVVVTTGLLHEQAMMPEKALSQMSAQNMLKAFEVNAMGPALVMKHFLPLFPKDGRAVFAVMSAKVGSISENNLGGWHSHRAAKAALNQFVKTAAVELKRRNPEALCVSIYPGTVRSKLSEPFSKSALNVREPDVAAAEILAAIESLKPEHTGGFFDYTGASIAF